MRIQRICEDRQISESIGAGRCDVLRAWQTAVKRLTEMKLVHKATHGPQILRQQMHDVDALQSIGLTSIKNPSAALRSSCRRLTAKRPSRPRRPQGDYYPSGRI